MQLSDAQLVVARSYGFASWRALKTEIDRRREALGILPPPPLDDNFYRPRPASSRAMALSAAAAEQGFFEVATIPFLMAPATKVGARILAFLIG